MSDIDMDNDYGTQGEARSIGPESSISQRAEQSSTISFSESKADPTAIGDYFIVKDVPEILEEAKKYLKVWHLLEAANLSGYWNGLAGLVLERLQTEGPSSLGRILRMCGTGSPFRTGRLVSRTKDCD